MGREGFLGGWRANASQDLEAIEPLSYKVSLNARAVTGAGVIAACFSRLTWFPHTYLCTCARKW